jgi:AcrR family transcriptional regulator
MEMSHTGLAKPGLRERKKQQTRERIASVALDLFAQHGYDHTTLAEIAEAADVAPRTIFAYFQSKEDILFCDEPLLFAGLERTLRERPPGVSTVEALREFVPSLNELDQHATRRKQIIAASEGLRLVSRARSAAMEELVTESIARDLGDIGADDLRPRLIAASVTATFSAVRDRLDDNPGEHHPHERGLEILDQVIEFLRGGLEALERHQLRGDRRRED